jgi:hypothetical protein
VHPEGPQPPGHGEDGAGHLSDGAGTARQGARHGTHLVLLILTCCLSLTVSLVWCLGQNKRIAPLSFLHGCRKRRLKD